MASDFSVFFFTIQQTCNKNAIKFIVVRLGVLWTILVGVVIVIVGCVVGLTAHRVYPSFDLTRYNVFSHILGYDEDKGLFVSLALCCPSALRTLKTWSKYRDQDLHWFYRHRKTFGAKRENLHKWHFDFTVIIIEWKAFICMKMRMK